ncbi:MAG: 30S ribosomal protein S1 [candidate division Zixibacteria bacterium]|nr:30S ribosomal protein S1 [candidate division Zixibacteria bacterium]
MAEKDKAKKTKVTRTKKTKKKGGVKKPAIKTAGKKLKKSTLISAEKEKELAKKKELRAAKRERKVERKKKELTPEPVIEMEEDKDYSPDEFQKMLSMYEQTFRVIKEGEMVKGRILGITKEDVIVDVGFKSEGIIPISEFTNQEELKIGDEVDLFLEAIEDQNGQLVLSKHKADFIKIWDKIKEAYDKGTLMEGKLLKRIKGGIVVDLMGVDAFLPGSQIALKQVPDFDALLGQTMQLRIIKLNKSRRNIVVSRRAVLEVQREKQRSQLLTEIEPGQLREGVVKNITDFGVFLDLGGVDGLLHITDLSWGRVSHPSEVVALGDKINVKILDFDKTTGRISLGLKQLTPYPWDNIEERYPVGRRVKGKVVSITDYGAFIELERGIEGLIHISEMSWTKHIKHPSKLLAVGDIVNAVVLSVDKENERISLGIKQMEPDPWDNMERKYPLGSKVTGRVRNLTPFGVFIEIEEGVDGLVHISDLSWTKRIQHPSEVMRKGERVEVKVLSIDKENRRISLGYKQFKEDPWPVLSRNYRVGAETEAKIIRLLDRGVTVDLDSEMEGFVPLDHLGKPDITKPSDAFSEGETIPLKVIEFDQPGRKIILSIEEYYKHREKAELEAFLTKHPTRTMKVKELVEEPQRDEIEKKISASTSEKKEPDSEPQEEKPPSE